MPGEEQSFSPADKVKAPGLEEGCQYYGPPREAECQTQVNAMGSWNPNGSWNPGKQRDAPWRDHLNFRWADNPNQQPQPQNTSYPNQSEGQSNLPSRNQEGQSNWSGGIGKDMVIGINDVKVTSNRNQNNQPNFYVPPHQMGNLNNNPNHQGNYQGNQGPNTNYNSNSRAQGNFHSGQGSGSNQYRGSGSNRSYSRPPKHIDNWWGIY